MSRLILAALVTLILLPGQPADADDWSQWLGNERDSVWRETGIVEDIPADGLPVKWRAPVGLGYAGPAVSDGRVFVADYDKQSGEIANSPGARNELTGKERLICLDAEDGEVQWVHAYDRPYKLSYAAGPRVTPTVDGSRVYTLGAMGDLQCVNVADGRQLWSRQLSEEYDVEVPIWGFAGHPLVDGDRLICLVGGEGSVAVAFNKLTGEEIWRALSAAEPGYCPPTMIEAQGRRQLLIWHPEAINSLNPETGEVYWSVPLAPSYGMSIAAPRLAGEYLFASGVGDAGVVLRLAGNTPAAEEVWRGTSKNGVYVSNSTPFLNEGMIFGCDSRSGQLMGVDLLTGERVWETLDPTTGGRRARIRHGLHRAAGGPVLALQRQRRSDSRRPLAGGLPAARAVPCARSDQRGVPAQGGVESPGVRQSLRVCPQRQGAGLCVAGGRVTDVEWQIEHIARPTPARNLMRLRRPGSRTGATRWRSAVGAHLRPGGLRQPVCGP